MRVGIVGAGIAGLACARRLTVLGHDAVLFDKGSRPGGRLSTLRLDGRSWDFGAQYLVPGTGAFSAQVAAWMQSGLVAQWPDGPDGALVGVPDMANLVEAQCAGLDVRFKAQIQHIERTPSGWSVSGAGLPREEVAALVIAVPPEQAIPLVSLHDFAMATAMIGTRSQPCWTVMAGFAEPLPALPAYMRDLGPIAWAARNNSKPGRPAGESWVLQAGPDWSQANLELDRETVAARLIEIFSAQSGCALPPPVFLKAHRWRFAETSGPLDRILWNAGLGLGVCGDWCSVARIEGAWLSGTKLAEAVHAAPAPSGTAAVSGAMA